MTSASTPQGGGAQMAMSTAAEADAGREGGAGPGASDTPTHSSFQVRPLRILFTLAGFAILAAAAYALVSSPNVKWSIFFEFLLVPQVISGVQLTLVLTAVSMVLGTLLGIIAAFAKMSSIQGVRLLANVYIWIFRGTPLLVQVIFAFNLALFIPQIAFGPWAISTNAIMTPFFSAALALTLNEGAYMAEYIRGAILGVDPGQKEAALSQGMSSLRAMRRVILPQAIPSLIPVVGNQTISMLKATSIVSVIAAAELLTQVTIIYNQNYYIIELLLVACAWYITIVSIASVIQHLIETQLAKRSRVAGSRLSLRATLMRNLSFRRA
ncbi:MAG: amino acid ABC transporter permease [Microbacterium sp.]